MKDTVQVKICGITTPKQAQVCARAGADAIGLVFYRKSPRFVERQTAQEICLAAGEFGISRVGVFVDEAIEDILEAAHFCGLNFVQLHGAESQQTVAQIQKAGLGVLKAFFLNKEPGFERASDYFPEAFLAECAGKALPGGNALAWDWGQAKRLGGSRPLILAGGLDPQNAVQAILAAKPDALDVSSGVEDSPGQKNPQKVEQFIKAAKEQKLSYKPRSIFP
ncbi:MAG: phosphoribosylanthranilate isomerase [Desulfatibacillaceae bacterium]|nr:phosphoribosylanthranilate isomerase [Desulfatibacillaceae bacterium]